ncbi:MAG: DUF4276 family protein [Alphaproteobacteria bacterium]|nr:DUF4276 family protein [Alphaproteobacteria bacterium]
MRPLRLALFPEGSTDVSFFSPLLVRVCEHLCRTVQIDIVPQVIDLSDIARPDLLRRADQIQDAASQASGAFDILFVHADGAGDPARMRAEQVDPGLRQVADAFTTRPGLVGLVPVREMEAWAIVDGDALRDVLGTTLSDAELGIPHKPALAESVTDPKRCLVQAVSVAISGRRGRRTRKGDAGKRYSRYLRGIGERVGLDCLRDLAAFRSLEEELASALKELRYLR